MDDFKLTQLTKELVALRLERMEDPCGAAAALVRRTLEVAHKNAAPETYGRLIEEAVRGGMQGLILAEQDPARGGALVLEALVELAQDNGLEPTETLTSGLRGMAGLRRLMRPDQLANLRREIDSRFHGAGEAFTALLRAQPDPGAREKTA